LGELVGADAQRLARLAFSHARRDRRHLHRRDQPHLRHEPRMRVGITAAAARAGPRARPREAAGRRAAEVVDRAGDDAHRRLAVTGSLGRRRGVRDLPRHLGGRDEFPRRQRLRVERNLVDHRRGREGLLRPLRVDHVPDRRVDSPHEGEELEQRAVHARPPSRCGSGAEPRAGAADAVRHERRTPAVHMQERRRRG
jgi:hypothetical protein